MCVVTWSTPWQASTQVHFQINLRRFFIIRKNEFFMKWKWLTLNLQSQDDQKAHVCVWGRLAISRVFENRDIFEKIKKWIQLYP